MNAKRLTIAQASQLLQSGDITPRNLVENCLDQVAHLDAQIRAWVTLDGEAALATADQLGRMLQAGNSLGPLHGIPWGIKDIVDVSGLPTRCGSPRRQHHRAETDAEIVAQLRAAGAIILGKTVTTEFACFDPPPTRNPWNLSHTPGGSSSGSAAAVATGMCLAAIGSQTGGSINRPASYCGVAGWKPTFGRFSRAGVFPVSERLDHVGPMAGTVADLQLVHNALGGTAPSRRLPLHRLTEFVDERTASSVATTTSQAVDQLSTGAPIESASPLPTAFAEVHRHHFRIMAVEAAQVHGAHWLAEPTTFGPNLSQLIETGLSTSVSEYEQSQQHQTQFYQEMNPYLAEQGALLLPATPTTAPGDLGTTGDPLFNSPWSYGGFPAVNFPCGLDRDGMPCGLQLVGARESDSELLETAVWCELQLAASLGKFPTHDLTIE